MRRLPILLALAGAALAGGASAVEVSVDASPRVVEIGDRVTMRVYVTRGAEERLARLTLHSAVSPEEAALASFDVTPLGAQTRGRGADWETFSLAGEPGREVHDLGQGMVRESWSLPVAPFETGELTLPAVTALSVGADGVSEEIEAGAGTIEVASAIPVGETPTQPRDPHGPYEMPVSLPMWPFAVAAAVALAGAVALWMWRRRGGPQRAAALQQPARPPHEVALAELDALERSDLISEGRHRVFFYTLTDIVRVYFEREFGIGAPEMTSTELLAALRENQFPAALCSQFEGWIAACDLVKYARQRPRSEHCETAITLARAIVTSAHHHHLALQAESGDGREAPELVMAGDEPRRGVA